MLKLREFTAYAVAIIAIIAAVVCVITVKGPASATTAAWVQSFGSIAAIVVVTLPVLLQHSLGTRRAKDVTLATVETAWGIMGAVAERYMDPERPTSEWWVPQWEIVSQTLAQCPIHEAGSADALRSFIHFRELFNRAPAFDEPPSDGTTPLAGFIGFIMTNAAGEVAVLRKLLT